MPQTPEERALKAWVARLLRVFGLTKEEYYGLLEYQDGKCPICDRPAPGPDERRFPVDHSHKFGHVRGIPCTYCNRYRIGRHNDPELLRRIADYIEHSPGERYFGERRVVPGFGKRKKRRKRVT